MSRHLRLILTISILASFVVFLDGSVVNVALPSIVRDFGGGLVVQQWVVDAYLITLGSLILLAGSLSDLFGRKLVMTIGLIAFGATSILCSVAPSSAFLILGRGLQGVAGALLVPSSLALIMSSFRGEAQEGKAIGLWTAWTGISFVIGPLLGGFLVDTFSWRLIFAINVIPIIACLTLLAKDKDKDVKSSIKLDVYGAILCSLGLFSVVFALIEQSHYGWHSLPIMGSFIGGLLLLAAFIIYEGKISHAMLPLTLFKVRNFSAGNIATIAIYGGLSIATFLIIVFLQQVSGYSALRAGASLLPITAVMFFLSPRFGKLAGKYGPRLFMTVGPIVAGIGFLLMLAVSANINYLSELLPGIIVFAFGLSMTVAPLTTAILGHVEKIHSGIASAVNNAISRIAGLIAIATIGVIVGSNITVVGFHRAILVTAILLMSGGVISFFGIRNHNHTNVTDIKSS